MKSLNNLLRKTKLGIVGLGLAGMLNLNACSTGTMMSATGAGMLAGASTKEEVVIGAVLSALGDSEVQKEAAREGKTEVNVYNGNAGAGTQTQSQPPAFDYSKMPDDLKVLPKMFVCNYWDDKNKDGILEFDEVVGLKNEFYSNEPITVIGSLDVTKGGILNFKVDHNDFNITGFLISMLAADNVVDRTYTIEKDGRTRMRYIFPPTTLTPGDYLSKISYQDKGGILPKMKFLDSSFKVK
jgi:hypothetical protein